MAIRFVVHQKLWKWTQKFGIFTAARHLLDNGELSAEQREQVEEQMEWFRLNLPVPNLRDQDKSAIFWYRNSATEHIRRTWELASLLNENDYHVEMIKSSPMGRIVYQDDFQFGLILQSKKAL